MHMPSYAPLSVWLKMDGPEHAALLLHKGSMDPLSLSVTDSFISFLLYYVLSIRQWHHSLIPLSNPG